MLTSRPFIRAKHNMKRKNVWFALYIPLYFQQAWRVCSYLDATEHCLRYCVTALSSAGSPAQARAPYHAPSIIRRRILTGIVRWMHVWEIVDCSVYTINHERIVAATSVVLSVLCQTTATTQCVTNRPHIHRHVQHSPLGGASVDWSTRSNGAWMEDYQSCFLLWIARR